MTTLRPRPRANPRRPGRTFSAGAFSVPKVREGATHGPRRRDSGAAKRPFEPFRIEVSDGTVYEIRHPELVMVGLGSLIIGIPPAGAIAARV